MNSAFETAINRALRDGPLGKTAATPPGYGATQSRQPSAKAFKPSRSPTVAPLSPDGLKTYLEGRARQTLGDSRDMLQPIKHPHPIPEFERRMMTGEFDGTQQAPAHRYYPSNFNQLGEAISGAPALPWTPTAWLNNAVEAVDGGPQAYFAANWAPDMAGTAMARAGRRMLKHNPASKIAPKLMTVGSKVINPLMWADTAVNTVNQAVESAKWDPHTQFEFDQMMGGGGKLRTFGEGGFAKMPVVGQNMIYFLQNPIEMGRSLGRGVHELLGGEPEVHRLSRIRMERQQEQFNRQMQPEVRARRARTADQMRQLTSAINDNPTQTVNNISNALAMQGIRPESPEGAALMRRINADAYRWQPDRMPNGPELDDAQVAGISNTIHHFRGTQPEPAAPASPPAVASKPPADPFLDQLRTMSPAQLRQMQAETRARQLQSQYYDRMLQPLKAPAR